MPRRERIWASSSLYGEGAPKNVAEAARLLRLAAEQGDVAARFNLGLMLFRGENAPKDPAEGYKWMTLAALQGDEQARREQMAFRQQLTPEQLA